MDGIEIDTRRYGGRSMRPHDDQFPKYRIPENTLAIHPLVQ